MMNCEYCGSRVFEADRVCDRCGAPNIKTSKKEESVHYGIGNKQATCRVTSGSTMSVHDGFIGYWRGYLER